MIVLFSKKQSTRNIRRMSNVSQQFGINLVALLDYQKCLHVQGFTSLCLTDGNQLTDDDRQLKYPTEYRPEIQMNRHQCKAFFFNWSIPHFVILNWHRKSKKHGSEACKSEAGLCKRAVNELSCPPFFLFSPPLDILHALYTASVLSAAGCEKRLPFKGLNMESQEKS